MSYPTLSDLNNDSLIPPLGARGAPDIGPVAVLVSTDVDLREIQSLCPEYTGINFFISTLFVDNSDNPGLCFAGPYIGAPYGVMLLESLAAKGAKKIVVLGWCGAVSETLNSGDLIVVSEAVSDEGTSRSYMESFEAFPVVKPSAGFSSSLETELFKKKLSFKRERIWTTDAIYRETKNRIGFFRNRGAKAVDMECSALFSAAVYRGVEIVALLVVSDEVSTEKWKPGFRGEAFKRTRKEACRVIVQFARKLAATNES